MWRSLFEQILNDLGIGVGRITDDALPQEPLSLAIVACQPPTAALFALLARLPGIPALCIASNHEQAGHFATHFQGETRLLLELPVELLEVQGAICQLLSTATHALTAGQRQQRDPFAV